MVAVMTTLPGAFAVTLPVESTVATEGLLLCHLTGRDVFFTDRRVLFPALQLALVLLSFGILTCSVKEYFAALLPSPKYAVILVVPPFFVLMLP